MDTVVLQIIFLMQDFANDYGTMFAMQTWLLGAWEKGRNWSKYCSVDNIGGYCYFICGWNVFLVPFLYFCYRCSIHLHTWTLSMHSTHTFNCPPYILMIKIILCCGITLPVKGVKWWRIWDWSVELEKVGFIHWMLNLTQIYSFFLASVAHIWFQLSAENSLFPLMLLSPPMPINKDPLHVCL